MNHETTRCRFSRVAWLTAMFCLGNPPLALAHEGHVPLPTKGVSVDVEKGYLVLSLEAHRSLGVEVAEVVKGDAEERTLAYVTLIAPWDRHAYASSPISGRVERVHVAPGRRVRKGETLAEIRSLELEDLQLDYRNARGEWMLADRSLRQILPLGEDHVVPEREVREAKSRLSDLANRVATADRKLRILQVEIPIMNHPPPASLSEPSVASPTSFLPIRSPIDGIVIHADVSVGRNIRPAEHLFEILDDSEVTGRIEVMERDLFRVRKNQSIEIRLTNRPNEPILARIDALENVLDHATHAAFAWTTLANRKDAPWRMLPGMTGQARIVTDSVRDATVIPRSSLLRSGAERFVLVETASTKQGFEYQRRNVVPGLATEKGIQVLGGELYPGDHVITTGAHELAQFFFQTALRLGPEARARLGLRVEPASLRVVEEVIALDGRVTIPPDRRADVTARLPGTLKRYFVDRGTPVHAGQLVAEVESLDFQDLQLDFLQARLRLQLHEDAAERLRGLDSSGALAAKRIWEAESLVETTRNQVNALQNQLRTLGIREEQFKAMESRSEFVDALPIRAPIAGMAVQFSKVLGQSVSADDPLVQIHDLGATWIEGFVSAADSRGIETGMPARISLTAFPRFYTESTIARKGSIFDPESRSLSFWIELHEPNAPPLPHNLLAGLSVVTKRPTPTLAVPRSALARHGKNAFLFVEGEEGRFERRSVRLGRSDDRHVEIVGGLREGERVAVEAVEELVSGHAAIR